MSSETPTEILAEVPLFALLDEPERAELAKRVELVDFPEGAVIFKVGDPGDSMYVLASGEVQLSVKTKTGEEMFLERPGAGDFFGEISLLTGAPRTATVLATTNVHALVIEGHAFRRLLEDAPDIREKVERALADRS